MSHLEFAPQSYNKNEESLIQVMTQTCMSALNTRKYVRISFILWCTFFEALKTFGWTIVRDFLQVMRLCMSGCWGGTHKGLLYEARVSLTSYVCMRFRTLSKHI